MPECPALADRGNDGRIDDASGGDDGAGRRARSDRDRGARAPRIHTQVWSGDDCRHRVNRGCDDDRVRIGRRRGSESRVGAVGAEGRHI